MLDAKWLDPRSGKVRPAEELTVAGGRLATFAAPDSNDWVLWLAAPTGKSP
jgi:hypothetical protein